MTSTPSDFDLVRQTLAGDTGAFGRLVDRYKEAAYGAAYARLGNFHDAQDIAQEAFIRAYHQLADLHQPARFGNWLYTIVRNLCNDARRARRPVLPLDAEFSAEPIDPVGEHERRALHRRVQRALAGLSQIHRETVALYYIHGHTCAEVGRFLDVPVGTVKRRLSEARERLKKEMTDMVRDLLDTHKLPSNFREILIAGLHPQAADDTFRFAVGEREQRRLLPIPIGQFQAQTILAYWRKQGTQRPLGYELVQKLCKGFGISMVNAEIVKAGTGYRAQIAFSRGKQSVSLKADPGDACALAVRLEVAIYVDQDILAEAKLSEAEKTKADTHSPSPKKTASPNPIQIGPDSPWAHLDGEGKIEKAIIVARIHPDLKSAHPSERTRTRRLADPQQSVPARLVNITRFPNTENILICLSSRRKRKRPYLPITIGIVEGNAIASAAPAEVDIRGPKKKMGTRTCLHDLIKDLLDAFGIVHERCVVDVLQYGIFYALNYFSRGKTLKRLDLRPSDSIALALRTNAQLAIGREVLEEVGHDKEQFDDALEKEIRKHSKKPEKISKEASAAHSALSLQSGQKARLAIKSRRKFTWESSNPQLASIAPDGVVQVSGQGQVTFTATWVGKK